MKRETDTDTESSLTLFYSPVLQSVGDEARKQSAKLGLPRGWLILNDLSFTTPAKGCIRGKLKSGAGPETEPILTWDASILANVLITRPNICPPKLFEPYIFIFSSILKH